MARNKNRIGDWLVLYLQDASTYTLNEPTAPVIFGVDYGKYVVTAADCYLDTKLNEVLSVVQDEVEESVADAAPEDGLMAIVCTLGGTLTTVAVVRPEFKVSTTVAEDGED
jgi:hypothetical protein